MENIYQWYQAFNINTRLLQLTFHGATLWEFSDTCITLSTKRLWHHNTTWWLCLVPTSTTRFASDLGCRTAKIVIGLYKEIFFMNNYIKFLNIEWRTRYSLTNFEDHFGLHASVIFLVPNMCGFWYICVLVWSQTLVVNWQN